MSYQQNYTRIFGTEDEVRRRRRAFIQAREAEKNAGDIKFVDFSFPEEDAADMLTKVMRRLGRKPETVFLARTPKGSTWLYEQFRAAGSGLAVSTGL